jgi:hypothetical protein
MRRFHQFAPLNPEAEPLHIRVNAFAAFNDEAVDPRRDNGQRDVSIRNKVTGIRFLLVR